MTAENQALLEAIRVVVGEAVAPLTERMDGLTDRMDRMEAEQHAQRKLLEGMDSRLTSMEGQLAGIESQLANVAMRVVYLDEHYETLEARTSQIGHDLFAMGERIDKNLAALRSDLRDAFHDLVAIQTSQKGQRGRIQALEEKVSELQQRLEKLENRQLAG